MEGWIPCLTDWIQMTAMSVIGEGMFGLYSGGWYHACDMWGDSLAVRQVGSGLGETSFVSDKWM